MNSQRRKTSFITFAASILIALGANQAAAFLQTEERWATLSQIDCDGFRDRTILDHNNVPNLDKLNEAWALAQKKLIKDQRFLNNSDLANDGLLIAEHGLLQDITTSYSKATTKQFTSLGEEDGWNILIPLQFDPKNDVILNKN